MAGRIRHTAEWLLAGCARGVLPRLPRFMIVALARGGGWCASHTARHLRRVALANLDLAFGDGIAQQEKKRILTASFQSFALVLLDIFWFSHDVDRRMRKWVIPEPALEELNRQDRARICLTMHLGNWELFGRFVSWQGLRLTSVANPLKNRPLDRMFNHLRRDSGQDIVPRGGALRRLIPVLRNKGAVALLLDQNTKPSRGGVLVDFFNKPVPVAASAAALARRTEAALWFGVCVPDRHGRYKILSLEQLSVPQGDDRSVTAAIVQRMEREVRERPHYWLWMYKRWKYIPPGYPEVQWPFYAKQMAPEDREDPA